MAKKFTSSNFTNWYQNLRIVLRYDKKIKFVEQPVGPPDPETADPDTIDKYYDTVNLEQEVACLMLSSSTGTFKIVKAFHAYKHKEGQSVRSYLLKIKSYLDTLECIGYDMPKELGVSLILNSLNKNYDQFVQNYNMHSIGKTIVKLHAILKLHEKGIPKKAETPVVLAIWKGKIQKDKKTTRDKGKDKGKNKLANAPKPKITSPPKRDNRAKDFVCHHCKEAGYWKRNCPSYQAELKKRKNAIIASASGSWKLKHGALSLYVGNRMRVAVEAIGSFDLVLPSSLIIVLDNCHFAPTINKGVVSISRLVNNGYIHTFLNYGNSVSKDNMFYFNAIHLMKRVNKLQRGRILQLTNDESLEKCTSCIFGKMVRKPFPHKVERSKDLLGLIHTDVCGPFRMVSREGASYFITFIDDFSRYGYVYLMKHKHEGYALKSIVYILNMVRTKKVESTPYEIWHGKAPKLSYLMIWDYEAFEK
nr:hypothetical protein [Tanacetum cinerariifolium]